MRDPYDQAERDATAAGIRDFDRAARCRPLRDQLRRPDPPPAAAPTPDPIAAIDRVLVAVMMPGWSFRSGTVSGQPYVQPGMVEPSPTFIGDHFVRWSRRRWFLTAPGPEFAVVRACLESAKDMAARQIHEQFTFDGEPVFRKS